MAVECCGKPRDSRFCPDCGKQLGEETTLYGLLKHCRASEAGQRTQAANFRESNRNDWDRHKAENHERLAEKWKAWGDALAELLAGAEGG